MAILALAVHERRAPAVCDLPRRQVPYPEALPMTFSFKPPHAIPRMTVQVYYFTRRECKSHNLMKSFSRSRHDIQVERVDATSTSSCLAALAIAIREDTTPSIIVFDCGELGEKTWVLFEEMKQRIGDRYVEYVFDDVLDMMAKDICVSAPNVTIINNTHRQDDQLH